MRACANRTKGPLTSVLFPSGSRRMQKPQPGSSLLLFFSRPRVAQKRSFTALAGTHIHGLERAGAALLFLALGARQRTGAHFHGPARTAAWQVTLGRSATGEQWPQLTDWHSLAKVRSARRTWPATQPTHASRGRVVAPPPQRLAWPPVSRSRPPRPINHTHWRAGGGRQPHRTSEFQSPPPGGPRRATAASRWERARARARAASGRRLPRVFGI